MTQKRNLEVLESEDHPTYDDFLPPLRLLGLLSREDHGVCFKWFYRVYTLGILLLCEGLHVGLVCITIYLNKDQIYNVGEAGTLLLAVVFNIGKLYPFFKGRKALDKVLKDSVSLFDFLNTDLCPDMRYTTKQAVKYARIIKRGLVVTYGLCAFTSVVPPVVVQTYYTISKTDNVTRDLIVKEWFPFDITTSPGFEVAFFHQLCFGFYHGCAVGVLDTFFFTIIIYTVAKFRMLNSALRQISATARLNTMDEDQSNALATCIRYHQELLLHTADITDLLKPAFVFEVGAFSLSLCVAGFQLTTLPLTDKRNIITAGFAVCCILEVAVYCWLADYITEESETVRDEVYALPWYDQPHRFKMMVWMVLWRTETPVFLDAGVFGPVSRMMFMALLQNSYSYMAILHQLNE